MKTLKKFIRKLYHLIWFLSVFLLFLIPVKADTTWTRMFTSYGSYNNQIQCNDRYCVVYNVPVLFNQDFVTVWGSNYSGSCNTYASVTGTVILEGSGEWTLNKDWLDDNLKSFVLNTNNVDYACSTSISASGNPIINYSCIVPRLQSNFAIAYTFSKSSTADIRQNQTSIIYRNPTISCSNTGSNDSQSIIDNNNFNTDREINSQNNNTDRIINDNRRENDKTREKIDENTDAINGLDDTLNDSSVDSSDNTINNLKTKIPTNSVVSDLLLLPVRFLQNFVNALGSSCSQFNLGSLYGTNLFMPCINIQNYLGTAIWTTIDLIISGMFVYHLRKKFIEIYQNLTNLKNGGNEVD